VSPTAWSNKALDKVGLSGFQSRRPAQMSGGQQQRVAVARALVFEPKLVLMDEPLSALDKQLREQLQYEIKRLHHELGLTVVYVTHDQTEAMAMSDRVAVFHQGRIQQIDEPTTLYERPANAFVAQFIGENNQIQGRVVAIDGERCMCCSTTATRSLPNRPVRCVWATDVVVRAARTDPPEPGHRRRIDPGQRYCH